MSVGLKGDLEQAHDLVNDFDWTLNEECYQYSECTEIENSGGPGADGKTYPGLQLFTQQNKAVWIAEYKKVGNTTSCQNARSNGFNLAWYKLNLGTKDGRLDCT